MTRINFCIPFTIVIGALSGCSPHIDTGTNHTFQIYEEDGVTIAESSGGPKYSQDLFEYEELYHLEQDESREESLLGGLIGPTLMDENGYTYIGDDANNRIAVFDSDGIYSHSIGRKGSGPGEFLNPRLIYASNDTVLVTDTSLFRTSIFRADGEYVISFRIQSIRGDPPITYQTMAVFPGRGGILLYNQTNIGWTWRTYGYGYRVVVTDSTGEVLINMATPLSPHADIYPSYNRIRYIPNRGIMRVTNEEPTIEWYRPDGILETVFRLGFEREPITEKIRQEVMKRLRRNSRYASDESDRNRAKELLHDIKFPQFKGFWYGVNVDEYGYAWAMEPPSSPLDPYSLRKWRIISPDGEYLGNTYYPERSGRRFVICSYGHLIYLWEDQKTGENIFTIYRINPAIEGLKYP